MPATETETFHAEGFQRDLIGWFEENQRDLPWREDQDPYKVWVSEIMLQQTRVDTVIPYFQRFMSLFPTASDLAKAEEETVLKAWEGLGYYSRARNLHQAVKEVDEKYGGTVPNSKEGVHSLKGVGPYTAGAILSIAYGIPAPAVDGNVMRVLSRIFTVYDDISKAKTRKKFEEIIEDIISRENPSFFNQGLMELGALICTPTKPACLICPVQKHCKAREEGVQELLPVKAKKKPPKPLDMKAVVIEDDDGHVLIERRPDTGLLAKLWQFPNIEAESEDITDLETFIDQLDIEGEVTGPVQHVKHIFSHIVWEIDVFVLQASKAPDQFYEADAPLRFVRKEEVEWYPFPVSHQKIIKQNIKV
ncbi:A/G-specific adenine glycosylase [Bacillus shivajii]|uniref:A/G-specific adenine glycosylase n=1 Tax=Bacillus shivajii TaxID=1983719 RepID=UPI001CFA59C0|nr:A/G-specific adenine glycosylase [Bacillus shivajii]UCZ54101.1 A/G-specific adenine glycosylase [Bacillus shivajii]